MNTQRWCKFVGTWSLVLLLGLLGSLAPAAPAADPPIRIGVSLGLTGQYENIARHQQRAYRLWEKSVNGRGGLLGRRVQLIIHDDKSDPAVARRIYEDLIRKDKVDFVFGPYSSSIAVAVAPIADKHGYPMLIGGASADEIWNQGYTFIVGVYAPAGRYAVGFLALLAESGIERIAVVSVDDTFSLSAAEGARRWAPQHHLRVTAFLVQPKADPDFDHAAAAAQRSGAQALLLSGHFNEAVQMRAALKRIGWSPAAYYATVGPAVPAYLDRLGKDAHGTFFTSLWEPREDLRLPGSAAFLHEYLAAYGEPPSYQAATAYAAGQILEQGVQRAGSTDRAAVRQALFVLDTRTIMGRYTVDRTGMQVKQHPLIVQWHGDRREIVWPPELRTAEPLVRK